MKCQCLFTGKNKKKYFMMLSAEIFYPACYVLILHYTAAKTYKMQRLFIKLNLNGLFKVPNLIFIAQISIKCS